mgnify:FL=1
MTSRTAPKKINFTKPQLAALEPPIRGRGYHYDARTPGLLLCVTSNGTKTFYYYRRVKGRPKRIQIGRFPDVSIEQARRRAAKLAGEIADGRDPQQERKAARAEMTFGELFDYFLEHHAKIHKRSWREDVAQYKRYLKTFASRRVSTITPDEWAALHQRVGKKNGPYAANRLLALVSATHSKGPQAIRTKPNPTRGITRFREKSRDRFLQPDELPRFFEANVLAMRWEQLHISRAEWALPETKNGESQIIHLTPKVIEILQRRQETNDGSDWVFPSYGKTGHVVEPKAAWDRIRKDAGLPDLRLHDLRRTLGSWPAATGTSLPIIGKSLGHKSQAATAVYARLNLDPVRESVDRATEAMLAAGKPNQEEGVNDE